MVSVSLCESIYNMPVHYPVLSTQRQRPTTSVNSLMSVLFHYPLLQEQPSFPSCSTSFCTAFDNRNESFSSSGGRRNVKRSLLTRFVEIFQTKQFSEKFQISALIVKVFLRWIAEVESALSLFVVAALTRKEKSRRAKILPTVLQVLITLFCAKRKKNSSAKF